MDWRVKGLAQKILSVTPGGQRLNSVLQQALGGLKSFESSVDSKVRADWLVLVDHMQRLSAPIEGRTFVEIGTGWYPTLPVCFHLLGAGKCVTYDLNRLLDFELTRRMLVRLEAHLGAIAEKTGLAEHTLRRRLEHLQAAPSFTDFCRRANLEYHAPADATATSLATDSIDVVFSNSVLEHVTTEALDALMLEAQRILKPGGLAIHSVNCADHYAYFDRKVSPINYLRYSAIEWWLWNNDLQYQNRLRANDFVKSAERAGLEIVLNLQRPRAELLASIDRMPIAEEFRHYPPEQLCTTSVDFVAKAG